MSVVFMLAWVNICLFGWYLYCLGCLMHMLYDQVPFLAPPPTNL